MSSSFTRNLGSEQGRVEPAGYTPVESDYAFVLGNDTPGRFEPLDEGDCVTVYQDAEVPVGGRLLRFSLRVRPPEVNDTGVPWLFTCTVDDVELGRVVIAPGPTRDLVDMAVNVSKLAAGNHTFAFNLRLGELAVPDDALLTEDGDAFLTEDGAFFILE